MCTSLFQSKDKPWLCTPILGACRSGSRRRDTWRQVKRVPRQQPRQSTRSEYLTETFISLDSTSCINISPCQICFPPDLYRENKYLQSFVHEHKPAHNVSVMIICVKPVIVLMDINDLIPEPRLVLSLTREWMSELKDKKLVIVTVTGRGSKCHFLVWQARHPSRIPQDGGVFARSSLIMSHLTAVLIPLYEWQRFPKKGDCVPLSPLPPHKSFLKCAISSYLYTLIICVKSRYLNHLPCWLAASPRPTRLATVSRCRVAPGMYSHVRMPNHGQLSLCQCVWHQNAWRYAGKDFATQITAESRDRF